MAYKLPPLTTAAERFLANRVHAQLGKSEESALAFAARPEVTAAPNGGAQYAFSLVDIVNRKTAERLGQKGRAA